MGLKMNIATLKLIILSIMECEQANSHKEIIYLLKIKYDLYISREELSEILYQMKNDKLVRIDINQKIYITSNGVKALKGFLEDYEIDTRDILLKESLLARLSIMYIGDWQKFYYKVVKAQRTVNETYRRYENAKLMTNTKIIDINKTELNAVYFKYRSLSAIISIILDEVHDRRAS